MTEGRVFVIIPALNEEGSVGKVIKAIPKDLVNEVIVVDNGSDDRTPEEAEMLGATVVSEPERGYGSACLAGIAYVQQKGRKDDIIVFLDADNSDFPEEMGSLIGPIRKDRQDMVVGSRLMDDRNRKEMRLPVLIGNMVICRLLSLILRTKITDLGPFRAIRLDTLKRMDMQERRFGWTTEMAVKAIHQDLRTREVKVSYRRADGMSKISGDLGSALTTLSNMIKAGLRYHLQS